VIDKIGKGRDITGLLYYLYGPGKSDEHTDPHLIAAWRADLPSLEPLIRPDGRRDFRRLTGLLDAPLKMTGRHVEKDTVWHCVLSAAQADTLMSDEQWNRIAADFMDLMGLAPRDDPAAVRWVAVRHGLSNGGIDHIHIAVTLARQDGAFPSIHNDYLRARRACREIERRYGLTVTAPADRTAEVRPSRAETERSVRAGSPEPPRITLRQRTRDAAATALNEDDFFTRLRAEGTLIRLRYSDRDPSQVTGYSIALPGDTTSTGAPLWYSGGKLAPDLTIPKLRSRWHHVGDSPNPMGNHLSERSARAFLRSAACSAAERTGDEAAYFSALNDAGLAIRYRHDHHGAITGYSLALPSTSQTAWYGGGQLGTNLTLPRLRRRWAAPDGILKPPVSPAETRAIWNDVITAASDTAERMHTMIRADPSAAADAAWATADLLRSTARAVRGPASYDLRRASAEFDRAARDAYIVVPRPSPAGDMLRIGAQLLAVTRPGPAARKLRVLIAILSDLAAAAAELREVQQRSHQATAARTAHDSLTQLNSRITEPPSIVAHHPDTHAHRPAEYARADYPVVPGQQASASGRLPRDPSPGPRRRNQRVGPAP
jgi:hypothetical protein